MSDAEKLARLEEAMRCIKDIQDTLPVFPSQGQCVKAHDAITNIVKRALS